MEKLVTRYATKSPEAADENQRRIEGVFEDLAANRPGTVSYIVLRLADDSFVHRRGRVPVDVRVSRGRLHLSGCVDADRAGGVTSCAIAVGSILDHLGHLGKEPFWAAVGPEVGTESAGLGVIAGMPQSVFGDPA
jgi:hypothetical protein